MIRHDRNLDCSGEFDSEDRWVYSAGVYPSEDLIASGQDMPWFQPVRVAGGWVMQGTQHNIIIDTCCLNTRWEWTITVNLRCDDPCVKPVELTAVSCGADSASGTLTPSLDVHRIIPGSGEDLRARASTRTFAVGADGSSTLVGSGWAGGASGLLLPWDWQGGQISHLEADGPLTDSRNPGGALTPGARYRVEITAMDAGMQVGDQVSLLCTAPAVVDCSSVTTGSSKDVDSDRLPDVYETEILGTNPERPDTDCDGATDTSEVASGSSPTDPGQTPSTLPSGKPAAKVDGRGDAGVTCGTTKFEWRTPALDKLGVPKGKRRCHPASLQRHGQRRDRLRARARQGDRDDCVGEVRRRPPR